MGNSKHTPGPWALKDGCVFAKSDGEPLTEIYKANKPYNTKANAQLIAAAPQLFKGLKRMVKLFESYKWAINDHEFLTECKEALKQVEGEE